MACHAMAWRALVAKRQAWVGWARVVREMKVKARQSIEDDVGDDDQQQAQFYEGEEVGSE